MLRIINIIYIPRRAKSKAFFFAMIQLWYFFALQRESKISPFKVIL